MFDKYKYLISEQRLEAYRQDGCNDVETMARCLWNISLCEALYPTFHHLEVGLRNSMHRAGTKAFRDQFWFKRPFMCDRSREDVEDAERELDDKDKDYNDVGRIIAELKFGFWTRLFSKSYEAYLWNNSVFYNTAFPNATRKERQRGNLAHRFDQIRRLRNRVSHHEPILRPGLQSQYDSILEAMKWIDPHLVDANNIINRFPYVIDSNYCDNIREKLRTKQVEVPTEV